MKPITGQYECSHRSGVGLDYFTSRLDRLTLQANGRFVLIEQDRSRIAHAAKSLMSGQQVTPNASETRREGRYIAQGSIVSFHFDDGTQEQGQLAANGEGIQIGTNFFAKVSDSTLLPPTHRMKKDMEDIAKGLKIAGAIGGAAMKAVKSIHDALETEPGPQTSQPGQATQSSAPGSRAAAAPTQSTPSSSQYEDTIYCDQCGAPARPGKRFCNRCGAPLA
jgi:membrane protease subunit (stomatin/prohibitin family)